MNVKGVMIKKISEGFFKKILTRPEVKGVRFDIQFLRAVAVIAVVIYHIWPDRLPGGFMGVDIFFVISGYLMTFTIWKSIKALKRRKRRKFIESVKFLGGFYARRIKRLAPAATACLLAILVAIMALGNYGIQLSTAKQTFMSAIFMQNWQLAGDAVDYLGADNVPTSLQHFWSLSIEEQFYFIWPLLILIFALLGTFVVIKSRKKIAQWIGANLHAIVIVLFTVVTFAYGFWLTQVDSAAAYFVTPARIWELAIGGIIVFLPVIKNRDLRLLLPWLGLAMCSYALIKWDGTGFPGWHALAPTIGTALIVWAGSNNYKNGKFSIQNLSKFRPSQFFGDISYSLYLYHWPVIILIPLFLSAGLNDLDSVWLRLGLLVGSVGLAYLSYRFIEQTTRKLHWKPMKVYLAGIACLLVVLVPSYLAKADADNHIDNVIPIAFEKSENDVCFGARATYNQDECGNPFGIVDKQWSQFAMTTFMAVKEKTNLYKQCNVDSRINMSDTFDYYCEFGDTSSKKILLMLGNSFSQQWYPAFDIIGKKLGYKIIGANSVTCASGLFEIKYKLKEVADVEICNKRFNWIKENLWAKADVVVMATRSVYFSDENKKNSQQEKDSAIKEIAKNIMEIEKITGRAPILIQAIPYIDIKGTFSKKDLEKCIVTTNCTTQRSDQSEMDLLYSKVVELYPEIKLGYIRIEDLLCDDAGCHTHVNGLPVYYNNLHLNTMFSASTSEYLIKELSRILHISN